jgi:hypothetical protein
MANPYDLPALTPGDKQQAFFQALIAAGGAMSAGGATSFQPGGMARANPGGAFIKTLNDRQQAARLRQLHGLQRAQAVAKMQHDKEAAKRQEVLAAQQAHIYDRGVALEPAQDAAAARAAATIARDAPIQAAQRRQYPGMTDAQIAFKIQEDAKYRRPERVTFANINGRVVRYVGEGPGQDVGSQFGSPPTTGAPSGVTPVGQSVPLGTPAVRAAASIAGGSPAGTPATPPRIAPPATRFNPAIIAKNSIVATQERQTAVSRIRDVGHQWNARANKYEAMPMTVVQQKKLDAAAASDAQMSKVRNEARVALPLVRDTARKMLVKLERLRDHPHLDDVIGMPEINSRDLARGVSSAISVFTGKDLPGTQNSIVRGLIQNITDVVFMQEFQSLKGGGAITEREGDAAKSAASRLNQLNLPVAEYRAAVQDLIDRVKTRVELVGVEAGVYGSGSDDLPTVDSTGKPLPSDLQRVD